MMAVEIDDCRFVRTDGVAPYSIGIRFGGSVHFIVDEEVVRLRDELSAAIESKRIQLTRGACPECKRHGCHALTCGNASREMLLARIESLRKLIRHLRERIESLRQLVTLWQGKHAILRQENNALRRKLKTIEGERSDCLARQWPCSVTQMLNRFRRGNTPHQRKRFQLALVIHAVDRDSAINEIEQQLVTFREDRVGEGGGGGFSFSMSYAIVDGE